MSRFEHLYNVERAILDRLIAVLDSLADLTSADSAVSWKDAMESVHADVKRARDLAAESVGE